MVDVIREVNRLIKTHETRNPFKIAKNEGFIIKLDDFDKTKGFYFNALGKKFININHNLDEFSQHIVCAHELGHGMLHDIEEVHFLRENTLFPVHSKTEKEANAFAAELILNDDFELDFYYNDGVNLDEKTLQKLVEIKRMNRK